MFRVRGERRRRRNRGGGSVNQGVAPGCCLTSVGNATVGVTTLEEV